MPDRKQKRKKFEPSVGDVRPTNFEIARMIAEDFQIVNETPEADPHLKALLDHLVDFSETYRRDLSFGVIRGDTGFALPTVVRGGVPFDAPPSKMHKLYFEFSDRLKAYSGKDLRRFRRCEWDKCRKMFFADRLNKRFCGEKCQNASNQQEHRRRKA